MQKILVFNAYTPACKHGCVHVYHVMMSENLHRIFLSCVRNHRIAVLDLVIQSLVWQKAYILSRIHRYVAHILVLIAVNQCSVRLYFVGKYLKLPDIVLKGRKDIHMIPSYAVYDGYVRFVKVKLGTSVQGRSEVFVSFQNHILGTLVRLDHYIEAFQLRSDHIVGFYVHVLQSMQYHGGYCRLSMASAHHYPDFVLA